MDNEGLENGRAEAASGSGSNIILVGAMGSGKTSVGWLLAKIVGYGFVDIDQAVESKTGKTVAQLFAEKGEESFRHLEREAVYYLKNVCSHVISVGGGALMDDTNWEILRGLGPIVWLNPPPEEIVRRFDAKPDELTKRPLLADLADETDGEQRQKLLAERLKALIGHRQERYRQANLIVSESFATIESTARLLRDALTKEGFLTPPNDGCPYDRWQIL